jgi:hypothetical protein
VRYMPLESSKEGSKMPDVVTVQIVKLDGSFYYVDPWGVKSNTEQICEWNEIDIILGCLEGIEAGDTIQIGILPCRVEE